MWIIIKPTTCRLIHAYGHGLADPAAFRQFCSRIPESYRDAGSHTLSR